MNTIIDRTKEIISGYYDESLEDLYIPENMVSEVFSLACDSMHKVNMFVLYNHNVMKNKFVSAISEAKDGNLVELRIVYNNIKQVKESRLDSLDKSLNISCVLLSNIKVEKIRSLYSFVLFDDKYAVVLENDEDGGYFLTVSKEKINECLALWSIEPVDEGVLSSMFLQEPLMYSADMMAEISTVMCSCDHINASSCYWYHSTWQYLRLMNMVSTPSWHHDFYVGKITELLKSVDKPSVLICGCADYSSFSYVVRVLKSLNKEAQYAVLDMCRTPLFMCEWYAKREKVPVRPIQCNIFDYSENDKYDLILTDAFLTRFRKEELETVLNIWKKSLKCGGYVITTVRIHDDVHVCPPKPSDNDVEEFRNRALKRASVWGEFINFEPIEISERAAVYAQNMRSNSLGDKESILGSFKNVGFDVFCCEDVELEGELYFSRYLRICARKE